MTLQRSNRHPHTISLPQGAHISRWLSKILLYVILSLKSQQCPETVIVIKPELRCVAQLALFDLVLKIVEILLQVRKLFRLTNLTDFELEFLLNES